MPLTIPPMPDVPAFAPLRRIAANLERLRRDGRANAAALNRIPMDRRRAEAERLDQFSDALRTGKSVKDADPGDAVIKRIDAERDLLLRQRDALRIAEAKEEADWRAYVAAHGPELRGAAHPVLDAALAKGSKALDDFRAAWAEADHAQRAVGLAHGARDPRGMPSYVDGKRLTVATALDMLAAALGTHGAEDDAAETAGNEPLPATDDEAAA